MAEFSSSKISAPHFQNHNIRFLPQQDKQLHGVPSDYNLVRVSPDVVYPQATCPNHPSIKGVFRECNDCKLTWLVSPYSVQDTNPHPNHNALTRPNHPYPWRSILVQIDGIYALGVSGAKNLAAVGVYFAAGSRYNISGRRSLGSQVEAEMEAAHSALWSVYNRVIPARQNAFSKRLGHEGDAVWCKFLRDGELGLVDFRVIIQTSSTYLARNICLYSKSWYRGYDHKWISTTGVPIMYSNYFDDINTKINELARYGVSVAWYHVDKGFVPKAHDLAIAALH